MARELSYCTNMDCEFVDALTSVCYARPGEGCLPPKTRVKRKPRRPRPVIKNRDRLPDAYVISERLAAACSLLDLTYDEMAELAGVRGDSLKNSALTLNMALRIAFVLDISLDWLCGLTDDNEPKPYTKPPTVKSTRPYNGGEKRKPRSS